jgi:subtilisin family serine protease
MTPHSSRTLLLAALVAAAVTGSAQDAGAAIDPAATAAADAEAPRFVPGEVLVRFKPSVETSERSEVLAQEDMSFEEPLPVPGLDRLETDPGTSVREAVRELRGRPEVDYAQPNFVREVAVAPDDGETLFDQLWGLENRSQPAPSASGGGSVRGKTDADIDAEAAWDLSTGSSRVLVGVVDSGVDYDHGDLAGNIWENDDGPTLGDDDRNGFRDDGHGWDFCGRSLSTPPFCAGPDNDPMDENGHGTHVAGTLGADGLNGSGMPGVSWDVSLMPIRVTNANSLTTDSLLVQGFDYAVDNGARVVNASFGGKGPPASKPLQDVVKRSSRTLFAVAAGNGTDNDGKRVNNDQHPDFLCNIESPNVVCVTASDQFDRLPSFANYGAASVDLAAPGVNVLSTAISLTTDTYETMSGTSMATPHVAGVAALGFALQSSTTPTQMKCALTAGVDRIVNPFAFATAAGGRLNAAGTLELLTAKQPAACITARPARHGRDRSVRFTFEASRPASSFQCRLDGRTVGCARSFTPTVKDGTHTLQVRALGPEGAAAPWSDPQRAPSYRFEVDRTGPSMEILGRRLELRGRRIPVRVGCPRSEASAPCAGELELRSKGKVDAGKRRRRVTFGAREFTIDRGRVERVVIHTDRSARRVVDEPLAVTASARAADALGNAERTFKVLQLSD